MKARIAVGSVLLLAVIAALGAAGCGSSSDETAPAVDASATSEAVEPASEPDSTSASETDVALDAPSENPAADASEANADVAEEPESTPIDASKAKAFVAFQEQLIPFLQSLGKAGAELDQRSTEGSYDGMVGGVRAWSDWRSTIGDKAEAFEKMRNQLGLSNDEISGMTEIELGIFMRSSGAAVDQQIAAFEKSLERMDPEQRSEAEKTLDDMREAKENLEGMKEVRAKYGDAIVDAMLALEPDLRRQYDSLNKAP